VLGNGQNFLLSQAAHCNAVFERNRSIFHFVVAALQAIPSSRSSKSANSATMGA
jgi:hypothetical protein